MIWHAYKKNVSRTISRSQDVHAHMRVCKSCMHLLCMHDFACERMCTRIPNFSIRVQCLVESSINRRTKAHSKHAYKPKQHSMPPQHTCGNCSNGATLHKHHSVPKINPRHSFLPFYSPLDHFHFVRHRKAVAPSFSWFVSNQPVTHLARHLIKQKFSCPAAVTVFCQVMSRSP